MDTARSSSEALVNDAVLKHFFFASARKIPVKGKYESVSTLIIREGPFGPFRANYSHERQGFIALIYMDPGTRSWRTVPLNDQ